MAKKKKVSLVEDEDVEDVPEGKVDEDGDEIIDLYDEKDNLEDDIDYDLSEIDDEMLDDETEDESFGYEVSEVEAMLRKIKCDPCPGNSSKKQCKVRDDFGCPPDKAKK